MSAAHKQVGVWRETFERKHLRGNIWEGKKLSLCSIVDNDFQEKSFAVLPGPQYKSNIPAHKIFCGSGESTSSRYIWYHASSWQRKDQRIIWRQTLISYFAIHVPTSCTTEWFKQYTLPHITLLICSVGSFLVGGGCVLHWLELSSPSKSLLYYVGGATIAYHAIWGVNSWGRAPAVIQSGDPMVVPSISILEENFAKMLHGRLSNGKH